MCRVELSLQKNDFSRFIRAASSCVCYTALLLVSLFHPGVWSDAERRSEPQTTLIPTPVSLRVPDNSTAAAATAATPFSLGARDNSTFKRTPATLRAPDNSPLLPTPLTLRAPASSALVPNPSLLPAADEPRRTQNSPRKLAEDGVRDRKQRGARRAVVDGDARPAGKDRTSPSVAEEPATHGRTVTSFGAPEEPNEAATKASGINREGKRVVRRERRGLFETDDAGVAGTRRQAERLGGAPWSRAEELPRARVRQERSATVVDDVVRSDLLASGYSGADTTVDFNKSSDFYTRDTPQDGQYAPEGTPRFSESVTFTEEDLRSCLQTKGKLTVFADAFRLPPCRYPVADVAGDLTSVNCSVAITATPGKKLRVVMAQPTSCTRCDDAENVDFIMVEDEYSHWAWFLGVSESKDFRSNGNKMLLTFIAHSSFSAFIVTIDVLAAVAGVDVVHMSPTFGYVQTAGNDERRPYFRDLDEWVQLDPLPRHVTLLSVQRMDIHKLRGYCYDVLEVYAGAIVWRNNVWSVCGQFAPDPQVVNATEIHVRFVSDDYLELTGFRLLFSFHTYTNEPLRGQSGLWNCSVAEWRQFQRHFLCNLKQECEEAEDEEVCFYDPLCGQGYITLKGRCYMYVEDDVPRTWHDANFFCISQGGYLASLNTVEEWEAVFELLKGRRSKADVYIGLKVTGPSMPIIYRYNLHWTDDTITFYARYRQSNRHLEGCGFIKTDGPRNTITLRLVCSSIDRLDFLCEFPPSVQFQHGKTNRHEASASIQFAPHSAPHVPVPYVPCPLGHLVHAFLACDEESSCWSGRRGYGSLDARSAAAEAEASCPVRMTSLPAMFACSSGGQRVPYTAVCDHRQQCADASDEDFCVFAPCSGSFVPCATSAQCIALEELCDSTEHCPDKSDELDCVRYGVAREYAPTLPPAVVNYKGSAFTIVPAFRFFQRGMNENITSNCPHTHFRCPGDGYCLPVFLRCNGVVDCSGRQDEADCDVYSCPGFYRCRGSKVCLHASFVCDGVRHCPEHDDELYCDFPPCPHNCTCHGLAFVCRGYFVAAMHRELRYLDAKRSGMNVDQLSSSSLMLIHLNLAWCGLQILDNITFPNLRTFDLSDNLITVISVEDLRSVANLQTLILSGNPLMAVFSFNPDTTTTFHHMRSVDLSRVTLEEINFSSFAAFPNLLSLNISRSSVRKLRRDNNHTLKNVQVIDMHGCPITEFQPQILSGQGELGTVFAENYKLCCPVMLPPMFNPKNCHAPPNRVSSCDSLLFPTVRVLLALCSCFAVLGNLIWVSGLVYAVRSSGFTSTDVFTVHQAAGDVLMGVCVAVVLVANRVYQGSYALHDTAWRRGFPCKAVGVLFLLSSQLSVTTVFLITLNRLSWLYWTAREVFSPVSAQIACIAGWAGSVAFAALLLLRDVGPQSPTAICFPLLVTAEHFAQATVAAAAAVVLNFFSSFATAFGQACVFLSVHQAGGSRFGLTRATGESRDVSEARRDFLPCAANAACWLLLGALLALTWGGLSLPDELRVHVGVLAVPLTSALRPLLYGLGVRSERNRKQRVERLMRQIAAHRRQK